MNNPTSGTQADTCLPMPLYELDTLGGAYGSRIKDILDEGSNKGYSTLKVQEMVRGVLEEIGVGFSQVYVETGDFAGNRLDQIFDR